jgi:hypothetical protein
MLFTLDLVNLRAIDNCIFLQGKQFQCSTLLETKTVHDGTPRVQKFTPGFDFKEVVNGKCEAAKSSGQSTQEYQRMKLNNLGCFWQGYLTCFYFSKSQKSTKPI